MKKVKNCFKFSILLVSLGVLFFSSCAKSNGRANLSEFLVSPYTADTEYTLKGPNGEISGKAYVSSDNGVQITFSSPDVFDGMTVENSIDGELGNIYFTYYGMRLPLPDKSLQKVNLLLSLFSGNMHTTVATLGRDAFEDVTPEELSGTDIQDISSAKKCTFKIHGSDTLCTVIYDCVSGNPYSISASDSQNSAEVKFLKIKRQ